MIRYLFMAILAVSLNMMPSDAKSGEKTIILATVNWEPFFSETLPNNGYFAEAVREAFKLAGYRMKIKWVPWQRALSIAKAGNIYHGVLGAGYAEDRDRYFMYTDPIDTDTFVFFVQKRNDLYHKKLSDLYLYTIGGMRGDTSIDRLKVAGFKVDMVESYELNIEKMLKGRIDCFIGSKRVIESIINKKFKARADEIVALTPPYKLYKYHIMISRKVPDYQTIVAEFNRGLETIKSNGTFDIILERHGF